MFLSSLCVSGCNQTVEKVLVRLRDWIVCSPGLQREKKQEKRDLMVGQTQNATAGTITYAFKYQNAKHYHSQLENNQNKITGGETNYFV